MRLIGQDVLIRSLKKHPDTRKWIASWVATVEDAQWKNIDDLRNDYPSADGVRLKNRIVITIFNVKGNEYRLLTNVNYAGQVVQVLALLTHAEYDKDFWKQRY
ncbi:MAG TPA: type II toxin-antitoxin system HigB family toxin [Tepidisphaeraceae bacterium]|nr:type II toxin-antitoxin system HigB family toxin [Tepidisphaeraceae bacterium]